MIARFLLLLVLITSCGPNARQATLKTTLTGLTAITAGLTAYSAAVQADIVNKATSREEMEAKLEAHRTARALVVDKIAAAYHALAMVAILEDAKDIDVTIALTAANEAIQAYELLKGGAR